MSQGILYGVGVGPGDPELMTLKAVRLIRMHRIIAVPGTDARASLAYRIAVQNVPELAEKEVLAIPMPMTKDKERLAAAHRSGAAQIAPYLQQGKNVVYLTLGDPTLYSSYTYLQRILQDMGFVTETVSGVSSVCAAAARLQIPLAEGTEELHILPGVQKSAAAYPGTVVLMKSGREMQAAAALLQNKKLCAAENCGMESERLYPGALPDEAGYFSLIIAKPKA